MFVISDRELALLSSLGLSNDARVLYLVFMRPHARNGKAMLDLMDLQEQMSVRDSRSLGSDDDMLQEMLFGLLAQGLITRCQGREGLFEDGETVFLPAADRSRRIFLSR